MLIHIMCAWTIIFISSKATHMMSNNILVLKRIFYQKEFLTVIQQHC